MLNRRNFLHGSAGFLAGAAAAGFGPGTNRLPWETSCAAASGSDGLTFTTHPKKAVLGVLPNAEAIAQMKACGLDGMEIRGEVTLADAAAARKIADGQGFCFHSVMGGGSVERLQLASELGAGCVLLVPGRVSGVKMPQPWEFKIRFDEKTNRLLEVVEGDNSPFADYISAHNAQMELARKKVEDLLPTAEKLGIVIGLENVWNSMWVHPAFAANFIKSFDSPFVQAYFDVGNNVKYWPHPEDWFDFLKGQIIRVHIKDYLLEPDGRSGHFARVMEGSVNWLAVRKKMEETGFNHWVTVELEGCPLTIEEQARRMTLILEGKPLS